MIREKAAAIQQQIFRINAFASKHMLWLILCSIFVSVLLADQIKLLKPCSMFLMAFITFSNSLGGGFRQIGRAFFRPLPTLLVMLVLHVIMPMLTLGIGQFVLGDQPLHLIGMLLNFSIPTAVSGLIWVNLYGGNIQLSLALVLLDTLLAPIVVPLVLRLSVGTVVQLDIQAMIYDLLIMVAIPAAAAMLIHQVAGKPAAESMKANLAFPSKLCLFLIIGINVSGCAPSLKHPSPTLFLLIGYLFLTSICSFAMGFLLSRLLKLDTPTTLSVTIACGMRNNSIGGVLATQFFPPEVIFPVALAPLLSQLTASMVAKTVYRLNTPR